MNIEEQIWTGDPVLVAVGLFRGTEDNRRLWGWYCRQLGRAAFRQLVYQKWRENETDGAPRWGTGTSGATGRSSPRWTSCANSSPPTAAAAPSQTAPRGGWVLGMGQPGHMGQARLSWMSRPSRSSRVVSPAPSVKHEPRTGRRDGYEEVPLCQYF